MHKITLKSVDLLVLEWFFMVLAWPLELHVRVRSHSQHPPLNGSSRTARTNIYARNLKIVGPCWHVAPLCWPTLPPLNAPWSMFSPSNLFLLYAKIAKSLARQKTSKLTLCFFSRANRLCPSGLAAMGLCWHEPNSSGPTTYFSCLSTYAYKNEQTCASLCFQCPEERGKTSFIEPPNTKATFVIRLDSRKYIDTHTQIQSEDLTRPTMQRYTILKCHAKAWRSRP